jgi:hypothetical protein
LLKTVAPPFFAVAGDHPDLNDVNGAFVWEANIDADGGANHKGKSSADKYSWAKEISKFYGPLRTAAQPNPPAEKKEAVQEPEEVPAGAEEDVEEEVPAGAEEDVEEEVPAGAEEDVEEEVEVEAPEDAPAPPPAPAGSRPIPSGKIAATYFSLWGGNTAYDALLKTDPIKNIDDADVCATHQG